MLKKTIKYTDYNGVEREEDFYFNLSKAEIAEMELEIPGGMTAMLQRITAAQDTPSLVKIWVIPTFLPNIPFILAPPIILTADYLNWQSF